MGNIINDCSHEETNSSSPEYRYSCCAAPKRQLSPLLIKNDFHPFKFKIVWLISPLHSSIMMQASEPASARLLLRKPSALSWHSVISTFWDFAPHQYKRDKSQ